MNRPTSLQLSQQFVLQVFALVGSMVGVFPANAQCTPAQSQDFGTRCNAQGAYYAGLEADCVKTDPSHFGCGFYPLPSVVQSDRDGLVCLVDWVRSPSGQESTKSSSTTRVLELNCASPVCPVGTKSIPDENYCARIQDIDRRKALPKICKSGATPGGGVGNPIFPAVGVKREYVDTGLVVGALRLNLTYDSSAKAPLQAGSRPAQDAAPPARGAWWSSNLHRRVVVQGDKLGALVARGSGRTESFSGDGAGTFRPEADGNDRLLSISGGYLYIDTEATAQETYDTGGNLTGIAWSSGHSITLTYSNDSTPMSTAPGTGYLMKVQDNRGRSIAFTYELPAGASLATGGRIS